MKARSFILCVALLLTGCNHAPVLPVSSDPIERAVQEECSKPEPQGMWAEVVSAPTNASPKDVAIKILSGPGWNGSSTNIVIVEMAEATIVHADHLQDPLPDIMKHWTVAMAETKSGTNMVFLQCLHHGNTNAVWTYFIR